MGKKRSDFAGIYKWNTKDLFKSDEEALKEIEALDKEVEKFAKFEGHILDSAANLYELLTFDTNLDKRLERVFIYGHLNNDADTKDTNYQMLFGKVRNIYGKYLEKTAYIIPELLESDYKNVEEYIKEEPKLQEFTRMLKHIYREKEHVLSKEVENALAIFSKSFSAPDEIMQTLSDSDFTFEDILVNGEKVELTESNYSTYIKHPNQEVRKQAFASLYKTYGQFKNTIGVILKNEVEKNAASAKLRKFKSSLESSLFANEIEPKVYFNLIEGVHKHLPSLYKYWEIKKKELKLDELHIYDTYTDIETKEDKKYSFEEAKELVLKICEPLGKEYQEILTKSFTEGWIDSCNNEGKRGGAYCTACYMTHPYVLLSYEGTLGDISTLAHELGHAMHYYYAINAQSYQDYGYSIFVAEVASQVNEILLSLYLIEHSQNNQEKKKLIDDLLLKYKSSVYRQTMFAEFELFIHDYTEKGNVLTYENMSAKYYELNKLYYGDKVIVDDDIRYEWERIPHFYMNFYVYQYATSFTAAVILAKKIYEGEDTLNKYLEFLKLGCTKDPIASLKVAGLDMTSSKVMDEAISFMDELLKMYEELQGSEKGE